MSFTCEQQFALVMIIIARWQVIERVEWLVLIIIIIYIHCYNFIAIYCFVDRHFSLLLEISIIAHLGKKLKRFIWKKTLDNDETFLARINNMESWWKKVRVNCWTENTFLDLEKKLLPCTLDNCSLSLYLLTISHTLGIYSSMLMPTYHLHMLVLTWKCA